MYRLTRVALGPQSGNPGKPKVAKLHEIFILDTPTRPIHPRASQLVWETQSSWLCCEFAIHEIFTAFEFRSPQNLEFYTAKMVKTSVLNDALNAMNNAEKAGKRQVLIRPSSKVIVKFLTVMQKHGYIGEFEEVDDHRSGKIVIQLNGRLNKCGVINPRYPVQLRDLEKWAVQLLPSRQFGFVVLTTSAGIMDHEEARRKHVAGKLLGFFY
ncbi:hypothetical protein VI817_003875 [Penicillium citrinum]|nr:hypothetical protein VI817_003875 [Penicillium citrinum]